MAPVHAFGVDHRIERVEPFSGFLGVDIGLGFHRIQYSPASNDAPKFRTS